jgi:hypothetical protein
MFSGRFSRRRFLASAGVTVTLPMLPSLLWSRRGAASSCDPAKRLIVYYYSNGNNIFKSFTDSTLQDWPAPPKAAANLAGSAWTLPVALSGLQEVKSDILLVRGLENQQRRRAFGDHAIGCGSLLTARKPTANKPYTNTSIDQVIADAIGACRGGLKSLQLGIHEAGPSDSFGTYYTRSVSWRGPNDGKPMVGTDGSLTYPVGDATALGKIIDPVKAFNTVFAGTDPATSSADAQLRMELRKSVLDSVLAQQASLQTKLNAEDKAKVDQLFTGIRELENSLQSKGSSAAVCKSPTKPATTTDIPTVIDQMNSLMVIAAQCDVTRVMTFMLGDALNEKSVAYIPEIKQLGGDSADHAQSHHNGDATKLGKFKIIATWKQQQMANFVKKIKAALDSDGKSVLANSLVMMTSELADGNRHNHDSIPITLAGQLGGLVTTDRQVDYPGVAGGGSGGLGPGAGADYSNVKTFGDFYISLASLFGVKLASFGDDGKEAIQWYR